MSGKVDAANKACRSRTSSRSNYNGQARSLEFTTDPILQMLSLADANIGGCLLYSLGFEIV